MFLYNFFRIILEIKKIGVSRRILRWCGRRESNPHTMKVTEPKSVESASSTTPA